MSKILRQTGLTRHDYQVISDWIAPNSHVMDLGCGNGALLKPVSYTHLRAHET